MHEELSIVLSNHFALHTNPVVLVVSVLPQSALHAMTTRDPSHSNFFAFRGRIQLFYPVLVQSICGTMSSYRPETTENIFPIPFPASPIVGSIVWLEFL
jgi:hypothetical protein